MLPCVIIARHLDLADNQLSDPLFATPATPDCPNSPLLELSECLLATNSLTSLPLFLCYCTSMRQLNLNENKLTSLPQEISLLQRLTHLSVKQNNLRYVHVCRMAATCMCDDESLFILVSLRLY